MDSEYILTADGELYHSGIKGMKWGIRRYQNKDGSLTPAGRKRYGNDDVETSKPKPKTVKDMTDAEIRSAIARKQLENQYLQYHPEPVKPESFAKKFIDQAVKPAAINAGRDFIEKSLKKVTGDILKDKIDPNSLEGLEAANKKLRAKITNEWLRKGIDTTANWEAGNKQYSLQKDMEKDANTKKQAEADEKAAKKAAKKAADEQKQKLKDDMKQYREYNENWYDNDNSKQSPDTTYSKRGGETTYVNPGASSSHALVVYDAPVTSLSTTATSKGRKAVNNFDSWDDYVDVDNDPTYSLGQRYVAGLLEAPKDRDD